MKIKVQKSALRMAMVLSGVIFAGVLSAQVNEYLPPPTGPYQSSVVINTIERNADHESQVYRFPPADLAVPQRDFHTPKDFPGFARDSGRFPRPVVEHGKEYPGASAGGSNAIPPPETTQPAPQPVNPWAGGQQGQLPAPAWPANNGVWAPSPYGYQQPYPQGYYNGYMMNPYPAAPSPWAVNPPAGYIGK